MVQQFLSNGNLMPGIHPYNMQDFEKQFVKEFIHSKNRPIIFNGFKEWLDQLLEVLPPRYIWLDGSYLTRKVEPNDMDIVVFYYPEDIQNEEQALEIQNLINHVSRDHKCDAYLCLSFEQWTQQQLAQFPNQNTKIMQTYWMGQFSYDRSRRPKGMVQVDKEELLSYKIGGEVK